MVAFPNFIDHRFIFPSRVPQGMSAPWGTLLARWFSGYPLSTFVMPDINQSVEEEDVTEGAKRECEGRTPPGC